MACTRWPGYRAVVTQLMETTNYLGSAGVRLVIQAALLVVAVIAARRYKLTGLWILVAAMLLTVFRDVMELVNAIYGYIDHHNDNPKPFIWTASAKDILEKVKRARKTLVNVQSV